MGKGSSGAKKGGSSGGGGGGGAVQLIENAKSFGDIYLSNGHNAETDEFFKSQEWVSSLSSEEKDATAWYTGSAYGPLNSALRAGSDANDLSYLSDHQESQLKKIDKALAKGELEKPIALYRGSTADLLGGASTVADIQKLVGAKLTDKGYVSASISKSGAFHDSIAYKILVPPGKGNGAYVGNVSKIPHEMEYLCKRNSSFQVMGVVWSKSMKKPVVTLQMIP